MQNTNIYSFEPYSITVNNKCFYVSISHRLLVFWHSLHEMLPLYCTKAMPLTRYSHMVNCILIITSKERHPIIIHAKSNLMGVSLYYNRERKMSYFPFQCPVLDDNDKHENGILYYQQVAIESKSLALIFNFFLVTSQSTPLFSRHISIFVGHYREGDTFDFLNFTAKGIFPK